MFYLYLCVVVVLSAVALFAAYRLFAYACVQGVFGHSLRNHYLQIKLDHMLYRMNRACDRARWSPLF